MYLFTQQINNWDDWGKVFQSIPAFTPLIQHIFQKENLPMAEVENLTPGTNAVFKVGEYVIKIFAPQEFGESFGVNIDVELFGMRLANAHSIPAPRLIADGMVQDKYHFRYMIMECINGQLLSKIENNLTYQDKITIGQNMRKITDKLNQPCQNFTTIDVMQHALADEEWEDEGFPMSFQKERLAYLSAFDITQYAKVYCHGDLHAENILVDDNLNVYIIDFADAMYAPAEYEHVYAASGLFCFEEPYMKGYFGNYAVQDIVDLCMTWLPIHVWGHSTIVGNLKPVSEITSLAVLREKLHSLIKQKNSPA